MAGTEIKEQWRVLYLCGGEWQIKACSSLLEAETLLKMFLGSVLLEFGVQNGIVWEYPTLEQARSVAAEKGLKVMAICPSDSGLSQEALDLVHQVLEEVN